MSDPRDQVPEPTTDAPSEAEARLMLEGSPDRYTDKVEEDVVEEDSEQELRPPKDPNVVWQSVPSVPDQMQKLPNTVRTGPHIDAVFNLSIKAELNEFNRIQGQATDQVHGLTTVLHHLTKEFHQGQFFALVTYSHLFYQKLQ